MAESTREQALERIRKVQENIAVVIGTVFALTLCIYFFTYAMLVDKGMSSLLWAQFISAIIMLLILIQLKRVSFFLTRLWMGKKDDVREILADLSYKDL